MEILSKAENIQNRKLSPIEESYKELKKHLTSKAREFIRFVGNSSQADEFEESVFQKVKNNKKNASKLMLVQEVKEETEEELRYAMDRLLQSLEKFKVVLGNLTDQLKNPKGVPEASLKNITRYIKSIEGISQICENED